MKNALWRIIPAVALAATLLTGTALSQSTTPSPHDAMASVATDLSTLEGEAFDIAFMSQMIEHHRGAVVMSEELLRDYPDAESRDAAEAILAAQGPEIEQMTAWLASWYGEEHASSDMTGMSGMGATDTANESAIDPDSAFVRAMIEHHVSAIDMSTLALVRATRSELRALARDIIVAQAYEVFAFQEWLAAH